MRERTPCTSPPLRYAHMEKGPRSRSAKTCTMGSRSGLPRSATTFLSGLLVALAGCGGESGSAGLDPATSGTLRLEVLGLPPQAAANLTLRGPGGYSRVLNGQVTTVGNLTPGTYQLDASP